MQSRPAEQTEEEKICKTVCGRSNLQNRERKVRIDLSGKLSVYSLFLYSREVGRCSGGLLSLEVQVGA